MSLNTAFGCSSSIVANPLAPSASAAANAANYANLSIDERDELMKNLQNLFTAHQREQLEQQQPTCSRSILPPAAASAEEVNGNASTPSCSSRQQSASSRPPLITTALDSKFSSLKSTLVDGQFLACFVIGGECRLCFPQLRALCLGEISTQKVDEAMKAIAIMNALANEEQLTLLKRAGVLQPSAAKCELITKTNAERLISVLKSCGAPPLDDMARARMYSLKVVHDCFGGCSALLYPNLAPDCLECRHCHHMFKPDEFCRHTHKPETGKDVCFWGFDASNWAYYIRMDDENIGGGDGQQEAERQLANFVENYPPNIG